MKRTLGITLGIVALLAAFAIGVKVHTSKPATASLAASTSSTTTTTTHKVTKQKLEARYESFVADVAKQAGISPATLNAAITTVVKERVQAAESAGKISADREKKIEAAIQDHDLGKLIASRVGHFRALAGR